MSWNPFLRPPTFLDLMVELIVEERLLEEVLEEIVETLTGGLDRLQKSAGLLGDRDCCRTAQG